MPLGSNGGEREGGGTRGFAVNVKGMGPYLLLPWRCSSGEERQRSGAKPQQPNCISGSAAATGKLPADYRRRQEGFETDSAGPNVGPTTGRPRLVIWTRRKEIEKVNIRGWRRNDRCATDDLHDRLRVYLKCVISCGCASKRAKCQWPWSCKNFTILCK